MNGFTTQVRETDQYDRFELHEFNRSIGNTKNLEESMRKFGWIDAYPMHVEKNGSGKLKIKAGHHRFVVAKKLGIPVKYIICDDLGATIQELEKSTRLWSMQDYLESYVRNKRPSYIAIKEYCELTGIGLNNAISMLGGESAGSNNKGKLFKNGVFKISDSQHAEIVGDIVIYLKRIGIKFANANLFVQAISRCVWVKEFLPSVFKNKCKTFKALVEKQQNLEGYLQMIDSIYNRQSKKKIPLQHLASETSRKRHKTFGKEGK